MKIQDVPNCVVEALDNWYKRNDIHFFALYTLLIRDGKLDYTGLEKIKSEVLEDIDNGIYATQWLLGDQLDDLDIEKLKFSMISVYLKNEKG